MDRVQTNPCEPEIADWLLIIRGEYSEIPGLNLTKKQAQRLWGLDAPTCDTLLDTLVHDHFLRRTATGQFARADLGH